MIKYNTKFSIKSYIYIYIHTHTYSNEIICNRVIFDPTILFLMFFILSDFHGVSIDIKLKGHSLNR